MGRDSIFERISELTQDTDYTFEMSDISDVEEFLSDEDNSSFEFYDEIEQLYNQLMGYEESED